MNKITLPLDSINYMLEVNNSEPIDIYLPKKVPNKSVKTGLTENKFNAIDSETLIRLYIKTQVSAVPTVNIHGMDDEVTIITNGSLDLIPNSMMNVTFDTTDGGNTWLVTSCNESAATAEGAEKLAKAAQEVAVTADGKADTAINTANTAKTNAETAMSDASIAKTSANSANVTATEAKSTAAAAKTLADEAKNAADSANVEAGTANMTASAANETAATAQSIANTANGTANAANGTANTANDTANSAKALAENAETVANEAKTLAEGALQKSSDETQTISSDLVLANTKKFLVQVANGGTPLGMFVGKYDELTDKATGSGLEQLEIGSPTLLMCLNHCGAEFTTTSGDKVVDGHIRVDYKVKAGEAVKKDQLAYMSDIAIIVAHIKKIEEQLSVNTEGLPALPEVLEL